LGEILKMSSNYRGEVFNKIIKDVGYFSYLELGVSSGDCCWKLVESKNKTGVDSNPNLNIPGVICSTTDDFFKTLNEDVKFDLIFIDAYHEKNQVFRDFSNSIKHLTENGIVILHDIYPLSESNTSIETSNGNVYEFWIELVDNYEEQTSVFIGNPGDDEGVIGIYFNCSKDFNKHLIKEMNHTYEYFSENTDKYIHKKLINLEQIIYRIKNKV
jgi:hypothetical protein